MRLPGLGVTEKMILFLVPCSNSVAVTTPRIIMNYQDAYARRKSQFR